MGNLKGEKAPTPKPQMEEATRGKAQRAHGSRGARNLGLSEQLKGGKPRERERAVQDHVTHVREPTCRSLGFQHAGDSREAYCSSFLCLSGSFFLFFLPACLPTFLRINLSLNRARVKVEKSDQMLFHIPRERWRCLGRKDEQK